MTCANCSCAECVEAHGPPIPEGVATPTPEELVAMLEARGWKRGKVSASWMEMQLHSATGWAPAYVPMLANALDYRRCARRLLSEAASVDGCSPMRLLEAVLERRPERAPKRRSVDVHYFGNFNDFRGNAGIANRPILQEDPMRGARGQWRAVGPCHQGDPPNDLPKHACIIEVSRLWRSEHDPNGMPLWRIVRDWHSDKVQADADLVGIEQLEAWIAGDRSAFPDKAQQLLKSAMDKWDREAKTDIARSRARRQQATGTTKAAVVAAMDALPPIGCEDDDAIDPALDAEAP